jgi:predicted peroxiredoxin
MTELLEHRELESSEPETIEKVSIVVSKGSLEGIYPALIMANGARMEGIEADLFFTFFGLDAIRRDRYEKIKVATVGNPGMHMATWLGVIPGVSWLVTKMMKRQMEKIDIPRRLGRAPLRLQGDSRHVRSYDGRLRSAGRRDPERRRVLRAVRRRPDHLHVAPRGC